MTLTATLNKNLSLIEDRRGEPSSSRGFIALKKRDILKSNRTYTAAIIGLGQIATRYAEDPRRPGIVTHVQAYLAHPAVKTVVGMDVNAEQRQLFSRKWSLPVVGSLKDLLSYRPDIISICTPHAHRIEIIKECLKVRPKAFLCEKPLAYTVKEAQQIQKIVGKIPFLVNFSRRFDPMHQEIAYDVQGGRWGKIDFINAYYSGTFRSNGSHLIDLIELVSGHSIRKVKASMTCPRLADQGIRGEMLLEQNQLVTLHHCPSYLAFELDIYLQKGRIKITEHGFETNFWKIAPSSHFSGFKSLKETPSPYGPGYQNVLVNALRNLINTIENKEKLLSGISQGMKALRVQEAFLKSAREKGKLLRI